MAILGLLVAAAACAPSPEPWRIDDEAFRAARDRELREPDGWLAVAGLFFLEPGANTVGAGPGSDVRLPPGSAPATVGRVELTGAAVRFEPASGVEARLNGRALAGPADLTPAGRDGTPPADRIAVGRVQFHLHEPGGRVAIRVRDPESPLRRDFRGTRWFPIDARWRVPATFVPYAEPRVVAMPNLLGGTDETVSRGEAVLTIDGHILRLVAFEEDGKLWFVFRDATAPGDTYASRFLYAPLPGYEGRLVLDFNRAENPPCAYNPFTTCPLPVPQNRLAVRIPAGERLPEHVPAQPHAPLPAAGAEAR
jgi:uncharacterized protein (DUF1684 family)